MRCAVIGSPIAHSLSPQLHRAGYAWLGLDWTYERHEVRAEQVAGFVAGLDGSWRGLSATMPCKAAIVALGQPDPVVGALGIANTVVFDGAPGDPGATRVANTDVPGVELVLTQAGVELEDVVVLGNGATARSTVFALGRLGARRVGVRARDQAKTAALARDGAAWGIEVVPATAATVVVSTVPAAVGASWAPDLGTPDLVFDVLYHPWPTPLATWAGSRGIPTRTGLDLLAAQAVGQLRLMTGRTVPFDLLRATADQALAPTDQPSSGPKLPVVGGKRPSSWPCTG
jgi:shikimate dehydrogenase